MWNNDLFDDSRDEGIKSYSFMANILEANQVYRVTLVAHDLKVSLSSRQVVKIGKQVTLTYLEFELLLYLMRHALSVITYDELLRDVWGYDENGGSDEVIKTCIYRLRKKIESPDESPYITVVRKVGYMFARKVNIIKKLGSNKQRQPKTGSR